MNGSPELRALYDSLDYASIQQMITSREEESIQLEFKRMTPHFRKHLAKAISGFSIASGGIMIWGVDSAKGDDGADHAASEDPIPDAESVCQNMRAVTITATDPPVPGVEHRVIGHPSGRGFIVTFIPASDGGPHMATAGIGQFFRRNAIGHHPMGQAELADAFGREPRPMLRLKILKWEIHQVSHHADLHPKVAGRHSLLLGLENSGRGLAQFAGVQFTLAKASIWHVDTINRPFVDGCPLDTDPVDYSLTASTDSVIHPGTSLYYFRIGKQFEISLKPDGTPAISSEHSDFILPHVLNARRTQPRTASITCPAAELSQHTLSMQVEGMTAADWLKNARYEAGMRKLMRR